MYRVCLNPLGRSFGGKNPLRRVSKNERKLMKQVKQLRKQLLSGFGHRGREQFYLDKINDLQRQFDGLWDINAETMKERDDMRTFIDRLHDRLRRRNIFYLDIATLPNAV